MNARTYFNLNDSNYVIMFQNASRSVSSVREIRKHCSTRGFWVIPELYSIMIVTNTDLPLEEVVKGYKDLWKIERSFRTIKSFIDIRPVNHRRPDRIEAHVFLCVLSFLLSRLLEKALKDEMTIASISDKLSELKALPVKVSEGIITLRTESENARDVLQRMNIPYPGRVLESVTT